MRYEHHNGIDYLVFEEYVLEIKRWYFNDPEIAAIEIASAMIRQLVDATPSFDIFCTADTKMFTLAGFPIERGIFTVQLGEVRNDQHGMQIMEPIPGVPGNSVLPMVQITGNQEKNQTLIYSNDVEFGYIAKMLCDAVCLYLIGRAPDIMQ